MLPETLFDALTCLAPICRMHPVNGMLLRKEAREVFYDWRFLSCAAVLGAICSMLYLETGTIWAPAVVHWIVVAVWLWEFDGLVRLTRSSFFN
jgi:predicted Abi (CAAX) family protease